jgi:hypothetical protein
MRSLLPGFFHKPILNGYVAEERDKNLNIYGFYILLLIGETFYKHTRCMATKKCFTLLLCPLR